MFSSHQRPPLPPTSRPLLKSQVELRTIKIRSDKGHLTQAPYQLLSDLALSGRPDAPVWEGRELELYQISPCSGSQGF